MKNIKSKTATPEEMIRMAKLFDFYVKNLWPYHRVFVRNKVSKRCKNCVASEKMIPLNTDGICEKCLNFKATQDRKNKNLENGDVLSNILVAYPIGLSVENYAKVHLSHHRHYFTDEDPDFLRKNGKDWAFPMSYSRLARLIFSDLIGLSFIKLLRGKKLKNKDIYNRKYASPAWARPAYYVLLLALVFYFNVWSLFLIYWVIPLISLVPLIVRFGAICEHVYGASKATVVDSSPLILLRWWEKLLLPNLNFTLHVYHHFFPSVPFCNLPKVHEIFQREGLVNEKNVFHGYWSYLQFLQTENKAMMVSVVEREAITN